MRSVQSSRMFAHIHQSLTFYEDSEIVWNLFCSQMVGSEDECSMLFGKLLSSRIARQLWYSNLKTTTTTLKYFLSKWSWHFIVPTALALTNCIISTLPRHPIWVGRSHIIVSNILCNTLSYEMQTTSSFKMVEYVQYFQKHISKCILFNRSTGHMLVTAQISNLPSASSWILLFCVRIENQLPAWFRSLICKGRN